MFRRGQHVVVHAPSEANRKYRACARMLSDALYALRFQWKDRSLASTVPVSARLGTVLGCSREDRRTTSLRATVMPAPVTGWRMLDASPRTTRPGVVLRADGIHALGMLRRRPPSMMVFWRLGRTDSGTDGTTCRQM